MEAMGVSNEFLMNRRVWPCRSGQGRSLHVRAGLARRVRDGRNEP